MDTSVDLLGFGFAAVAAPNADIEADYELKQVKQKSEYKISNCICINRDIKMYQREELRVDSLKSEDD